MALSKEVKLIFKKKKKEVEKCLGMTIEEHRQAENDRRTREVEERIEDIIYGWL